MLVDDLPTAVTLALELVGEAEADGRAGRARCDRVHFRPRTDEHVRPEDLNLPIRHMIVRGLHADEGLGPAGLHLAVGGEGRLGPGPVSYTHLRAHETPEHLVCR